MDLRQLAALTAVAEAGSFSAAARRLHTVQSNVSTHVARLEKELGATLVDRSSGRLTEEGEAAVARARRIEAEVAALTADVAALRDEVRGAVRLGVIGSIGRWLMPDLLATMRDRHPNVELVVVDATTTSLMPQLLDGSLDVAIVNLPVNDPAILEETLFEEERILVVPEDHELAGRDAVTVADLAPYPLLLEPRGTAFRDELDRAAAAIGVQLRSQAEVDGMTMLASLAIRGYGPAILPTTATLMMPPGPWVAIPLRDLEHREVGIARRRAGRLAAPARVLLELVRELVAAQGPLHHGVEVVGRG